MDSQNRPLNVSQLGQEHGLSGQEMNQVLLNKGFLFGEPGAYGLTEAGEEFGTETDHHNGYGGSARREWSTTHFDPRIRDELEITDEEKQQARKALRERRAEQAAERQRRSDEFYGSDEGEIEADPQSPSPDGRSLLALLVAVVVIICACLGIKKYREWRREKRAAGEQAVSEQKTATGEVDDEADQPDE